ncbi:MAG: hypothetical protein ACPL28_12190 [bacterium]
MANLGRVYKEKGDKERAIFWLKRALENKENLKDWQIKQVQEWLKELQEQK